MNIQELEDKHYGIPFEPLGGNEFLYKKHTKLSVEFAVEQLESIIFNKRHISTFDMTKDILNQISELKTYLDEKS